MLRNTENQTLQLPFVLQFTALRYLNEEQGFLKEL